MSFQILVQQAFAEYETLMQNTALPMEERFHPMMKIAIVARMEWLRLSLLKAIQPPTVQTGPFAGMRYHSRQIEGCYIPKLLGCYELELHATLQDLAQRNHYDRILNIGCGDGYYAVGLARLFFKTPVFAFDINPQAQARCRKLAEMNGLSDHIRIAGELKPEALGDWLSPKEITLVVCDIEGGEFALLGSAGQITLLKQADCIVEFHHHLVKKSAQVKPLLARFEDTHTVHWVEPAARNPHSYPCLEALTDLDKWLCCCEYRPCPTPWGVFLRKSV